MATSAPFKDRIHPDGIGALGRALAEAWQVEGVDFDPADFVAQATAGLQALELKARVVQVADAVQASLPADQSPEVVARVVQRASGPALVSAEGLTDGFGVWPLLTWVERHGLDHPAVSLALLRQLTKRFSAEFAVRPYLEGHPELAWAAVHGWVADENVHVRRLASEGTRPRLPWGGHLRASIKDPSLSITVLDKLVDDPERYVQRSVANHLGDLAKDHPELAVQTARRWLDDGGNEGRAWIVRHGLRHLVKKGHKGALAVLGFGPPKVELRAFDVHSPVVLLGERLEVSLELASTSSRPQKLVIDLAVHFLKKNGQLRPKVFKWTTRTLKAGTVLQQPRSQPLKAVSTRTHNTGTHRVELLVNGESMAIRDFELVVG